MCAPKPPSIEKTPERSSSVLPNGGDPSIRAGDRAKRRGGWSANTIMQAATLGTPATTNPLGQTGNG